MQKDRKAITGVCMSVFTCSVSYPNDSLFQVQNLIIFFLSFRLNNQQYTYDKLKVSKIIDMHTYQGIYFLFSGPSLRT